MKLKDGENQAGVSGQKIKELDAGHQTRLHEEEEEEKKKEEKEEEEEEEEKKKEEKEEEKKEEEKKEEEKKEGGGKKAWRGWSPAVGDTTQYKAFPAEKGAVRRRTF